MKLRTNILSAIIVCLFTGCDYFNQNDKSIQGIYFASSTDSYRIIELKENNNAKSYSSSMGGEFESDGKWSNQGKSIQIIFKSVKTTWNNKKSINDTLTIELGGKFSIFDKITTESEKSNEIDKLITKVKSSVMN